MAEGPVGTTQAPQFDHDRRRHGGNLHPEDDGIAPAHFSYQYSARGEATLTPFFSNQNGVAYNMTGTVTIDG